MKYCLELLEEAGGAQPPAVPAVVSGTLPIALGAVCDPSVMSVYKITAKGMRLKFIF